VSFNFETYSRYPYGCRWCGTPKDRHGWRSGCLSSTRRWEAPQDWLIKVRMQLRKADSNRWQRPGDEDR